MNIDKTGWASDGFGEGISDSLPRHVQIALCEMVIRELAKIASIFDDLLPKATGDI